MRCLLVLALVAGGAGCGPAPRAGPPDLILVSVDTLRPDHLGAYGDPRGTTPHLDRLARDAVRFDVAIAQAPSTLASHASIFTSQLPSQHGALISRQQGLPEAALTVTEVLAEAGYRRAAFVAGGQVAPVYNLDQGFEVYVSDDLGLRRKVGQMEDWLGGVDPREPVFVFLHSYEVHHPYRPDPRHLERLDAGYRGDLPDHIEVELLERINGFGGRERLPIDAADLQHVKNAYDAGIAGMDEAVERLVRVLREQGRYENAAIVFTSDHGEEFGEHGVVGWHSQSLHGHQVRVPLLLKLPGGAHAGRAVPAQVRSLDIAPTLAALAGRPVPAAFRGRSLLARLGPDADLADWPARSERDLDRDPLPAALRDGRYVWDGERLYDLAADPLEQRDRAAALPDVAARLDEALRQGTPPSPAAGEPVGEIPEDTRRRLRELGYVE